MKTWCRRVRYWRNFCPSWFRGWKLMIDRTHSHKNIFLFLFLFWTFLHLCASLVNSPRGVVCPFVLRHFYFAILRKTLLIMMAVIMTTMAARKIIIMSKWHSLCRCMAAKVMITWKLLRNRLARTGRPRPMRRGTFALDVFLFLKAFSTFFRASFFIMWFMLWLCCSIRFGICPLSAFVICFMWSSFLFSQLVSECDIDLEPSVNSVLGSSPLCFQRRA